MACASSGTAMGNKKSPGPSDQSPTENPVYYLGRGRETTAERVRRLQAEANILARQEVESVERALLEVADMCQAIAEGGEAYPVGVREICSRIAEDLSNKVLNIRVLMERTPESKL